MTTSTTHSATRQTGDALLTPFAVAVTLTVLIAWSMLQAMQQAAMSDLSGQIESLLPLARLALLTAPLIVAARAATAAVVAWLTASALGETVAFRAAIATMLLWLPLLELPALVDSVAMLLHDATAPAAVHIPLGLDALVAVPAGRVQLWLQLVNLPLLLFTVLVARRLRRHCRRGLRTAVPVAVAAAAVLTVLPLLRF